MDDLLRYLEVRAATIDERLSDRFLPLPGEKKDADKAAARLSAWCRASASGNWELFARRLARDGLSLESVLPRLATVRSNLIAPTPGWLADSAWILNALQANPAQSLIAKLSVKSEPLAFESLLFGVVDAAEGQLRACLRPADLSTFSDEAIRQLMRALLGQLSALCAPAFFDAFIAWTKRRPELTSGAFEQFVMYMRESGLAGLFLAKPVLLRLMASITRQWIESTCEFMVRLSADVTEVRRLLLGLSDSGLVVSVRGELSDLHNFGRSVLLVEFADQCCVLYKPKDLRPDALWHELVAWLNANGAPVDLRAARVLVRDGYGWAEFIKHTDCVDRSGVAIFYERAGAWLGLFHIFAAADMHLENMIAAGEQPVPIDLEMILQPGEIDGRDKVAEREALELASKRIDESITAVGLLPAYARSPENDVVSLGGLSGSKTEMNEVYWENVNTDKMHPAQRKKVLALLPNLPTVNGSPARLHEFTGLLKAGFDRYAKFLAENKVRIVEQGFFEALAGVPVRRLLRPTRFYVFLLERLKDHRNLGDGAEWSANLEFIARLTDWDKQGDKLWPLFRAERNALADLNVPFFLAMSDGIEVADRGGISARDRDESGLARALRRLRNFDQAEVDWQSRIVNVSTSGMPGSPQDGPAPRALFEVQESVDGASIRTAILAGAREAAEHIAAVAIRSGPGAAWIGLDWLGDSEVSQLVPLGFDLYNGAPGISLFLAAYAQVTGDPVALKLSLEGLAPLRSHLKGTNGARLARGLGLGGASGLGSVVYALSAISDLLGKDDLLADALRAAQLFTDELIAADKVFDVIGGSAGGILGLLKVHRLTGDDDALAHAVKCGEHLLRNRLCGDGNSGMWAGLGIGCRPLTGVSHGAAGFGYALTSLHQATGREDFAAAAHDCIEFENRFFSPVHTNWPDLRQGEDAQSWPCQWCYGAGGIGLARIAMSRCGYREGDALCADIAHAVKCAKRTWPSSVDTLCCGNLGNIEFLDEAGVFLNDRDLRSEAEQRVLRIVAEAKRTGDYRWGSGEKQFNLGLFRGMAGIGYTLLRRVLSKIPNVLIWE